MGNWNGNYGDGTNPNAWRSSVEIMRKYANNKTPVKYGQCWVFGAILCSGNKKIKIIKKNSMSMYWNTK